MKSYIQQTLAWAMVAVAVGMASGCIVAEPREGYYDRDHHRYYHERGWHECGGADDRYCR